jgi:hypothetical protein
MTTFWKSLAEVAKGQLFIGGHLSPSIVSEITGKRGKPSGKPRRDVACCDHSPWPRLAIPH